MAEEPMLEAKGIVKYLGEGAGRVQALKGVNLDLMPGELTLLMGPSGSGKTTLLSILGCILTPNAGSLRLARNEASGLSAEGLADLRRKHVGFVFQSYNLVPTLTATENVMLALDLRGTGLSRAPALAAEALRQVGLYAPSACHAQQDERRRKAACGDRPCAGRFAIGDPGGRAYRGPRQRERQGVMALLAEVAKERSRAILVVTHDHRTLTYADRLIRIEDGRIVGRARARKLVKGSGSAGRVH